MEQTVLGSYRLVQRLGEGGMGVVHLALDRRGRAVALKVLRPHVAHDPAARARLSREVETLGRIRSPRVAPVVDADIDGDRPYIVTRYVPGAPLDETIGSDGPMEARELHRLGAGLAEALDAIHGCDVVHRDLKPGNVLMVDGDPVVIDFGIAHVTDDVRLTMTGLVMGTPGYLAPEVVEGDPVSTATDWWGWAATLAYAATGRPPFGRGPMDAVLTRVIAGDPDLEGVDKRIAPLLYAALAPSQGDRPHEREVVAALERYARGGKVTDVIKTRPPVDRTQAVSLARTSVLPLSRRAAQPTSAIPPVSPTVGAPVVALPTARSGGQAAGQPASPATGQPGAAAQVGQAAAYAQLPQTVQQQPVARTMPHQPVPQQLPPQQMPQRQDPADAIFGPQAGRELERTAYPQQDRTAYPQQQGAPGNWSGEARVDPRINRASRSGTIAGLLALLVATAMTVPVVAALALLVWTVLARSTDRSVTALIMRRHERGPRRSDVPVAVVASPWHLLMGILASVFGLLMPALIAVSGAFVTALALAAAQGGGTPEPNALIPLGVGGLLAGLMAWWGPGGASLRRGTRSILRGVSPGASASRVVGLLLIVGAVAVAGAGVMSGEPSWWPTGTAWADRLNLP